MISKPPLLALLVLTMLFSCVKQEVDLIVHNATIYTVDEQFSIAEAMAISGNRIVDIGPEHEVLNKYAAKKTIDAEKKAVFPGFIDAHCHFYGYGLSLQKVNLTGTSSFQEVISRLIAFHTAHPDQWITGRGWDQNDWEDKHFPNKTLLDSLFPDVPVFVKRIDGHAALANQVALTEAGITPTTRIEGGIIEIQHGRIKWIAYRQCRRLAQCSGTKAKSNTNAKCPHCRPKKLPRSRTDHC
jgi:predicted amidohydrolase YtcJ